MINLQHVTNRSQSLPRRLPLSTETLRIDPLTESLTFTEERGVGVGVELVLTPGNGLTTK